jgi:dihydrofolate synthase/folylpolyglutamate synthase
VSVELRQPTDLAGWLAHLEARNREAIVLGLERVRAVSERLGLRPDFPLITVGGTNGKGSTCAFLEAMLTAGGWRVGRYASPHLLRYNERVRIAGKEADDQQLVAAFDAVEVARGDIPLTYFEQGTLAAMWLFRAARIDVAVLEVGLGGRLDAVNAWDADCAVVVSVDLDHQAFLGDTREAIGFEKAGIYRSLRPAICGDLQPPQSLLEHAQAIGALLQRADRDWRIEAEPGRPDWTLRIGATVLPALPRPAMPGKHQFINAACAVAALQALREHLPVSMQALRAGLASARVPGRFQIVGDAPLRILDVAHNPHAARALAATLAERPPLGQVRAVFAMLADKDNAGVISALKPHVQHWYAAGLPGPRGLPAQELAAQLDRSGCARQSFATVAEAWQAACGEAGATDTILALGSFHTVAEVMAELQTHG